MDHKFESNSFLFASNAVFIEELYKKYLNDPNSVDQSWRDFFLANTEFSTSTVKTTASVICVKSYADRHDTKEESLSGDKYSEYKDSDESSSNNENFLKAKFMIMKYREHAHYLANLDPLGVEKKKTKSELCLLPEDFGFTQSQMSKEINLNNEFSGIQNCRISELVHLLDKTYAGNIAVEFAHIENTEQQKWLYNRFERSNLHPIFSDSDRKNILQNLVHIEGFEQYLHKKFSGAKRFSIEGGDTTIVALEHVIDAFAENNIEEIILGLAHRGRLSTLTKVMQKPYRAIFSEFIGASAFTSDLDISGDVKYHMGYSSDRITKSGKEVHLSLTPNPSHLEAVNPVVAGKVRAKQDIKNRDRNKIAGILIHGDAAFCGQGIVAESLVMSALKPYNVNGILHFIINNQIGFTANSYDSREGRYCTEVAKVVGAPILHVNGDDVESVLLATQIAIEYKIKFSRDVVVDIVCYRKYGHNEGDEPMYTQSMMYNIIHQKDTPATIYANYLLSKNIIAEGDFIKMQNDFKKHLDDEYEHIETFKPEVQWMEGKWKDITRGNPKKIVKTGVKKSKLQEIGSKLCDIPKNFDLNNKLQKLFALRSDVLKNDMPIDWATAEQLAFATILDDKFPIRITGQDVERGTFSHRHSVLHSQSDSSIYEPLNNISEAQARYEVEDSNLSEYGVLGFEYGYSLVNPKHLVIWEAQFGDFANGAQIMFDQFIFASETKWMRMSGLVVLLPHGYEGQGPEHSSARLERFLQLAAENNVRIVYPTTPASIFHLLRRQVYSDVCKPLIVMSPKSLLRHKLAVSNLSDIDEETFFVPVIDEIDNNIKVTEVTKIIFCTGKIYYDLLQARQKKNIKNIAIIRLEELYPFHSEDIVKVLRKYVKTSKLLWVQEEPRNMGAWNYIKTFMSQAVIDAKLSLNIEYVGRKRSASPAVGYFNVHNKQQEEIISKALV